MRDDVRARLAPAAAVTATLCVFFYTARFHEFWRDEAQTALIARAVPLLGLLPEMRREAVPPVVFLLLKALDVFPAPYSLAALGALGFASALFGTYRLLVAISGSKARSALATAAFALTDTYFYELGVVVRQYGLGLGFALASVAYLGRALVSEDRSDARWGAAFGALAVSTAVHPGCLAGSALVTYSLERYVRKRTWRALLLPLCTLPFFLFTFFLITSYDRAPEGVAVYHRTFAESVAVFWTCLLDGSLCHGWWTRETLGAARGGVVALAAIGALGSVAVNALRIRSRPEVAAFYAVTFLLNVLTLSYVFVVRYAGFYRHHLFMVTPIVVAAVGLLLIPGRKPVDSPAAFPALRALSAALLLPWFSFQYWTCATDLADDASGAFSGTKAAAAALPRGARVVVAGKDFMASGILYWRPDVSMRAQSSLGRPFRFLLQDWDWHGEVPLSPLLTEECRHAREVYVAAPLDAHPPETERSDVVVTTSALLSSETFRIYDFRCPGSR